MIIRTKVFELYDRKYRNLSELASGMRISVSQIYRVRQGERYINGKFIMGAIQAFPEHKFDELFYFIERRNSGFRKQRMLSCSFPQ